jgi:hypothetical protein
MVSWQQLSLMNNKIQNGLDALPQACLFQLETLNMSNNSIEEAEELMPLVHFLVCLILIDSIAQIETFGVRQLSHY